MFLPPPVVPAKNMTAAWNTHVTLRNCTLSGSGFSGQGLASFHGDNVTVHDCYFDNSALSVFNIGLEISNANNPHVYSNRFDYLAASGGAIRFVHTDGGIIEKNWINKHNPGCPSSVYWGIVPRDPHDNDLPGGDFTIVRNNIIDISDITECTSGSDCAYGLNTWNDTGDETLPLYIINNTFIGHGYGSGLKLQGDSDGSHDQSVIVKNNIFYNFGTAVESEDSLTETGLVQLFNNNYHACNSYYESDGDELVDRGGSQNDDPLFTGESGAAAYNILSTSPCRNSGVADTYASADDYVGNARTGIVDIGAFEYTRLSPTTTSDASVHEDASSTLNDGGLQTDASCYFFSASSTTDTEKLERLVDAGIPKHSEKIVRKR